MKIDKKNTNNQNLMKKKIKQIMKINKLHMKINKSPMKVKRTKS